MSQLSDPTLRPIFQPSADAKVAALVVAGACGNVGFGKLGQFARLLARHKVPVVALDLSQAVDGVKDRLREAYGDRFKPGVVDEILDNIVVVRGGVADLPSDLPVGFVFEAIPERLPLKHDFYRQIRARDPEAYIFSATSGFPSTMLFEGLPGAQRCGVMHPFFPHLTNKLWEVPLRGAVTGKDEAKVIKKFLGGLGMNLIGVGDVPSFAADRIFCGMMLEAVRLHVDLGISPAAVDDVCRQVLGTSPFYVHNMIPGANYLSAHCMELMKGEVDSTLYAIPPQWQPYVDDPKKQWPYEKTDRCPPQKFKIVRDRMLGMLICLTAYMVEHKVAKLDALNFLCENALAFRQGVPAMIEHMGLPAAAKLAGDYLQGQKITHAQKVAPIASALSPDTPGWNQIYVHTSVMDGVGLISLKRLAVSDTFIAELDLAYEAMAGDDAVKAIVVAPDGTYSREFGHGADLHSFVPVLGDADKALALIQRWKKTLSKLRRGKPTVAALVGRVLGGGLELAAACHARIAGQKTHLAFPETTVGVIPGLGGCHHLHRLSQPQHYDRINELLLTGAGFGVDEALAWGVVSEVVEIPALPAASMKFAAHLADNPQAWPAFREGPVQVTVDRDVSPTNEKKVPLDADLRDLLARTIEDVNNLPWADGSNLEEQRAAQSLAMSSSKIGVKAMLRGKAPAFENPLA